MRLREALAWGRLELRELPTALGLVLLLAHHPRLRLLWPPLACRPEVAARPALTPRARYGGFLGDLREHRPHHQPLPRGDHLARLLRRQRHQRRLRCSLYGSRLLPRLA